MSPLLGEQYQFVIATHIDHDHIHNHIVFNNTNMISGYTFETEHNQGKNSRCAAQKIESAARWLPSRSQTLPKKWNGSEMLLFR